MEQEYWTSEHADKIEENMEEDQRILDTLDKAQEAHEKGGLYFKTTKKQNIGTFYDKDKRYL